MDALHVRRGSPGDAGASREPGRGRGRVGFSIWGAIVVSCGLWLSTSAAAAVASDLDLDDVERLYQTGKYEECARMAAEELGRGLWSERWAHLKIRADLARGNASTALTTYQEALRRFPASVTLHLLGREADRAGGRVQEAAAELDTIERLIVGAPYRYSTPEGRLALGRFFLLRGADARKVLDQFYDIAIKDRPDLIEAYYASAELALDKQDDALAAETLAKAPKEAVLDPRYHYLLARAFSAEDRAQSDGELAEALKINPRHVDSLLLQADHLIDAEKYAEAGERLDRVLAVNPREPRAWAYRAVLAHLRADPAGETAARSKALEPWKSNPEVDHLIGRKLSQKYRFAEGADAQRRALAMDSGYLPAQVQLCQDLLRLGDEAEGWRIAAEVFARDGYNVLAYNLITLRDRVDGFRTLDGDGLIVRMDPREADLYGARVLALLGRARRTLGDKYGVTLREPVIVEIFPQKKEFAVRTFGLPGAEGFLGVCFGRVITANSPASQGESPSNWEAVLWHEFCHVVTLNKSHNKMPRWLSEGISVYEEAQENATWATPFGPHYRAMILGDDFTPLSKLSAAFLAPESPLHLQFAYFESALAVEFLVDRFGLPALKGVLDDLGAGTPINEALPQRTEMTLTQLDEDFARFARRQAEGVAPEATWEEPDLPGDADSEALAKWVAQHPRSFPGLQRLAARLVTEEKWPRAREVLRTLRDLYPEYVGTENAYMLLARIARHESDPGAERQALEDLSARSGDAADAYLRLIDLDTAAGDWRGVARNARRLLAVNPLIPPPHRALAHAAEQLGERDEAVAAYRALTLLDDTDPAEVHFRLAKLLRAAGKRDEARREVLRSLEEAPRFREAHRLLLELVEPETRARSR